ncbi:hypothetical protein HYH02_005537 [Chlamydomonas schloesseri]|uniref:Phosphoglycerate mutase n=1 Tax=Chlamydomonas schloesseri TaxID=2026947 RepID=A0A835WL43_9CHLO|nr:hypothetical protein HYH02_005537 [Chlamydomonas schloesseri]|eukprot:KAG2449387.1 hypothetical protein HYH02_005537 [Chlamydomonas schloesseri]
MDASRATEVFLVRHGQTDWNAEMRLQGQLDPPLNDLGEQQAEEVAAALADRHLAAIYSSDLTRALQTARAVAGRRPAGQALEVRTSPQLRERSLGVLEGLTIAEAAVRQPEALRLLRSHDPATVVPGGESAAAMRQRVVADIERICEQHRGQSVLIVAHGGVLHHVYAHVCGHAYGAPITNASVHHVRVQPPKWALVQWNMGADGAGPPTTFGGGANEG